MSVILQQECYGCELVSDPHECINNVGCTRGKPLQPIDPQPLINILQEIIEQPFELPPVEDDPEGNASVYWSGADDAFRGMVYYLKGNSHALDQWRRNKQ